MWTPRPTNVLHVRRGACSASPSQRVPGSKLRYCGRCEIAAYCSKPCARADWDTHKISCERLRQTHGKSLAAFVAMGGRTKYFNRSSDDIQSWFRNVPGLDNEIELIAWSHQSQAPIIVALASDTDVDGSTIRVQMIPRSLWDEDPRFLDTFTADAREEIRTRFAVSTFSSSRPARSTCVCFAATKNKAS